MRDALLYEARDRELYWERIQRLVLRPRSMTLRAAHIVVDAAMYGIGCTEGTVRKQIEEEQHNAEINAG